MTFLVVAIGTQSKTAKLLTTPTFHPSPPSKNFLEKFTSCSAWGVHLQLTRTNYANFFLTQCTPLAMPMV